MRKRKGNYGLLTCAAVALMISIGAIQTRASVDAADPSPTPAPAPSRATGYKLPWVGGEYGVWVNGPSGHSDELGGAYWAIDFDLGGDGKKSSGEVSGLVCAAKDGTVVYIKRCESGSECWRQANMVVIGHGQKDGKEQYPEYSWYLHMVKNSVPEQIRPGVLVKAGTVIGTEGGTGLAYPPGYVHLHFMVSDWFPSQSMGKEGSCKKDEDICKGGEFVPWANEQLLDGTWVHHAIPVTFDEPRTDVDDSTSDLEDGWPNGNTRKSENYLDDSYVTQHPRGEIMQPGKSAELPFTIQNIGNAAWTAEEGYTLERIGGTLLGDDLIQPTGSFGRGEEWTGAVRITAPEQLGEASAEWQMAHNGKVFGERVFCSVLVAADSDKPLDPDVLWEPVRRWIAEEWGRVMQGLKSQFIAWGERIQQELWAWLKDQATRLAQKAWHNLTNQCCGMNPMTSMFFCLATWSVYRKVRGTKHGS